MKKSERYKFAMMAVVNSSCLSAAVKLDVLETLVEDKRVAEWSENNEKQESVSEV